MNNFFYKYLKKIDMYMLYAQEKIVQNFVFYIYLKIMEIGEIIFYIITVIFISSIIDILNSC